jgi:hypothetical protein
MILTHYQNTIKQLVLQKYGFMRHKMPLNKHLIKYFVENTQIQLNKMVKPIKAVVAASNST